MGLGRRRPPAKRPKAGAAARIPYDAEMIELLVRAESKVGELRGKSVSNPHTLIRAHLKREAVLSSRIEGTMASLEDLNTQEALGNTSFQGSHDMRLIEVQNHVKALEYALDRIRAAGSIWT